MAISDIASLASLRTRMHWHQERQRLLAENVANADTPGFKPRDLAPMQGPSPAGAPRMKLAMKATDPAHLAHASSSATTFRQSDSRKYETRPAGNAVNLEDEMLKVASNQMDYQAAASLYSRSLALLKTAVGKR